MVGQAARRTRCCHDLLATPWWRRRQGTNRRPPSPLGQTSLGLQTRKEQVRPVHCQTPERLVPEEGWMPNGRSLKKGPFCESLLKIQQMNEKAKRVIKPGRRSTIPRICRPHITVYDGCKHVLYISARNGRPQTGWYPRTFKGHGSHTERSTALK